MSMERIRRIARGCGYAIAVHGSEQRDLDLIAVPWTDAAVGNRALVDALVEHGPFVCTSTTGKPHGRIAYVLHGAAGFDYIDLSVCPRRPLDITDDMVERAAEAYEFGVMPGDESEATIDEKRSMARRVLNGAFTTGAFRQESS